jgi:hypothetical protein
MDKHPPGHAEPALRNWSSVRPPGPLCERRPPRRPADKSLIEDATQTYVAHAKLDEVASAKLAVDAQVEQR